ncbi:hypothetical protein NDN08_000773 [Rhodosorus marinus]|uniref:Pseudouridine synthase RsuA/RluA-like domain-containing protein n=1 Tax=Rhodosorus marinus TaxID=101924 RepID=A0AAV8UNX6_9RHOD|nr:hypothetical protein NDN08_000773 [Rhodosorus marinus]
MSMKKVFPWFLNVYDRPYSYKKLTVPGTDAGIRLLYFLRKRFPAMPYRNMAEMVRLGQIQVESVGLKTEMKTKLRGGQKILVPYEFEFHEDEKAAPELIYPKVPTWVRESILYQDDDFFIINKPAGVESQPGGWKHRGGSILTEYACLQGEHRDAIRLVHRLDKDCTGAMVLARNIGAARYFSRLLKLRSRIRKTYWAIVHGNPAKAQGRIQSYLEEKPAITEYRTLGLARKTAAWLEMIPVTGRKRQLRTHCAQVLGCPIIGDHKFSDANDEGSLTGILGTHALCRLHLHAWEIEFPSITGKMISVRAPVPKIMLSTLNAFGMFKYTEDPMEADFKKMREKLRKRALRNITRAKLK